MILGNIFWEDKLKSAMNKESDEIYFARLPLLPPLLERELPPPPLPEEREAVPPLTEARDAPLPLDLYDPPPLLDEFPMYVCLGEFILP